MIRPFSLRSAGSEEYARLNALKNVVRAEVEPDDPPYPCAEDMARWQAMPELVEDAGWAAWDAPGSHIIAFGEAYIYHTGDNPHVMDFNIEVLPKQRRQGLGREVLRLIAAHARDRGRELLMTECSDRVAAASAFLTRMGGRKGLDQPIHQLRLAELNLDLVKRWTSLGDALLQQFTPDLWDGPYPEEHLKDLASLLQVAANDMPRDSLEMEDINFTPEFMRQFDRRQRAGNAQRWTLCLRGRADGRLAGITEVLWSPNRPRVVLQGFTGVMPEHRNRGLGRWLKASMLTKILRERPQVELVRSENADSNAPMLKINQALGFKQHEARAIWQVPLDAAEAYLASRG